MTGRVEARLAELNIALPTVSPPAFNYVPTVQSGSMLYVSGQVPVLNGAFQHQGKLGAGVSVAQGQAAARLCALTILAQAQAALGSLDRVVRVVKLVGFVNCDPSFGEQPKVVNGASDLMVEVLGDKGRHARSAVGMAALPFDVSVEVEAVLEVA